MLGSEWRLALFAFCINSDHNERRSLWLLIVYVNVMDTAVAELFLRKLTAAYFSVRSIDNFTIPFVSSQYLLIVDAWSVQTLHRIQYE